MQCSEYPACGVSEGLQEHRGGAHSWRIKIPGGGSTALWGDFALLRWERAGKYLVWMGDGSGLVMQEEQSLLDFKECMLVGSGRETEGWSTAMCPVSVPNPRVLKRSLHCSLEARRQ